MPTDSELMRQLIALGPVTAADLPPDANDMTLWDPNYPAYGFPMNAPPTLPPSEQTTSPSSQFQLKKSPTTGGFDLSSVGGVGGLAAILGGLGLGLARPRIAPQALQNFSAANTLEWRDEQKRLANERLALQKQDQAMQMQTLAEMQRGEGGTTPSGPPQFTASQAAPPAPPEASQVPHFAAQMPTSLTAPTQLMPESRMVDQPFFPGQPTPIRGNTSNSLSAFGRSQTRSTNRGTEKEQATTAVLNDIADAIIRDPQTAQKEPRRLYAEAMSRYGNKADGAEVRKSMSSDFMSIHANNLYQQRPDLDPKTLARDAYRAASMDLGPLFMPTDQMRTLATQVAAEGEHRGLAIGKDDKSRLGQLNIYEGNQAAAVQGAKNAADIYTKGMSPSDLQSFENPPPIGSTMGDVMRRGGQKPTQAGQMGMGSTAPMSKQRQVNVETGERERMQRQVTVETVAPALQNIVRKAEDIRKAFSDISLQDWYSRGKNWADVMQSQGTGFPLTEKGKLVQSYDTMIQTNKHQMARAVQGQMGNLTEQEGQVGLRGFPETFHELYNNPISSNDRLAVLGDVIALELRDPTFRFDRLDAPMSEFEKVVETHRQQRITTRPELYGNAPAFGMPTTPQGANAPPTLSSPMLTPEDKAISDQIQRELQQNVKPRKK